MTKDRLSPTSSGPQSYSTETEVRYLGRVAVVIQLSFGDYGSGITINMTISEGGL